VESKEIAMHISPQPQADKQEAAINNLTNIGRG